VSKVNSKGPFFDKAKAVMADFKDELELVLAEEVYQAVRSKFSVFKNPSGYYESRVSVENNKVTDHGVVYGSFLEKGGRGFRGYQSFEKASKEVDGKASQIAEKLLSSKFIGRLN